MSMIINPYRFGAAGDPYWANVVFLLRANSDFTDDSASAHSVTAYNGASIVTDEKKYGAGSIFLDGTNDYFAAPNSADFQMGSDDFTLEFWYRPSSVSGVRQIVNRQVTTVDQRSYAIITNGTSLLYYLSSNATSWDLANGVSIGTVANGNWYHVALCRDGSTFRPFLDGVQGTTTTSANALHDSTQEFRWGQFNNGAYVNGHIDDIRVTKGVARYTANFTPPATEFPDF